MNAIQYKKLKLTSFDLNSFGLRLFFRGLILGAEFFLSAVIPFSFVSTADGATLVFSRSSNKRQFHSHHRLKNNRFQKKLLIQNKNI